MVMFKKSKLIVAAVATATALAISACGGVASSGGGSELRAANLLPPNNAQSDMIAWFMGELEKRTDGDVKTEVVYGGGLLAGDDTLPGMQEGRAEAGNVVPAYFPAELPLNNVNMVPIDEGNQASRVRALQLLADEVDAFAEEFEQNDMVLIGFLPNPSSAVAVSTQIDSINDLKGLKIRTPSQPQSVVYEELGAESVFMPSEEVYESVERGIVDGVTYPMDVEVSNGITEVAKFMAPDVGQNGGSIFALSKAAYDKLPDDAKDVVAELREEWATKSDRVLAKYEAQACKEFLAQDGTIVKWSDADQRKLAQISDRLAPQVWKSEAQKAGVDKTAVDEVWETYTTGVEDLAAESDYEDGLQACGK